MQPALRVTLAVAVSAGLYTASFALAPLATPLVILVPLPGLLLAALVSLGEFGLWSCLTAGVVFLTQGGQASLGFLLSLGLPSLALALAVQRRWHIERTVVAGVLGWSAGVLCLSLLTYGDVPALVAATRQQVALGFDLTLSASGPLGAGEEAVAALVAEREALVADLVEIVPALVVVTGALIVLANLALLRRWAGVWHTVNLRVWRTPDALIWFLIAAGFGMFAPLRVLAVVARNVFIVLLGCYFCQGLAIVSYYLERFKLPRGFRIASYVLIAVQQIVTAIVLAVGVFDLWGNFRRLSTGTAGVPLDSDRE